jgi:hypothetical protein
MLRSVRFTPANSVSIAGQGTYKRVGRGETGKTSSDTGEAEPSRAIQASRYLSAKKPTPSCGNALPSVAANARPDAPT